MVAARVDQGAHATVARARDNRIARLERTALDENGGNRAAALVEVRLDDEAGRKSIGIGLELEHVGLQKDGLEQVVDADALLGGNVDEHVRAAPFLGNDAVFHQLLAYAVGRGAGLVDLVDGNHDRHVRRLRVVDGLDGLRHDAVVRRHDQDDDVGHLGAASTHGGKRLVARGVDEGDLTAVDVDDGSADVLRDAAGLARGNAGMANRVERGRLAVVDMTHNGDHGRTRLEVVFGVVVDDGVLFLGRDDANLAAHIVGNKLDELVGHGLGDRENLAQHEQTLDDVVGRHAQKLCELADRRALHDLDDAVVEHQIGIDALFDGLHGHTFALSGLSLFLALLATAFALVARSGGDGSARLGENLVALELLSLHGHLGVAVFARCVRKLGNLGLEMMPATLAALAFAALLLGGAGGSGRLLVRLLCADTGLLGLDLRKQRIERRRRASARERAFRRRSAGLDVAFLRPREQDFPRRPCAWPPRPRAWRHGRRQPASHDERSSAAFCSSIWRARLERPEDTGAGAGFFFSVGLPAF